jgi:hypothetical protein
MTKTNLEPEAVWGEVKELAESIFDADGDEKEIARSIAEFLDALLPLNLIAPGVIGEIAETQDGPLLEKAVEWIIELLRVDPDKKAERQSKRKARRTERKERREAKWQEHQAKKASE